MEDFKLFHHDELLVEEVGVNYMDQVSYSFEGDIDQFKLKPPYKPSQKFTAFLDGTMRLYKVCSAAFTGTPLHVATISTALLYRGKDRHIRNTKYSKHIFLLLFPFKNYVSALGRKNPERKESIKDKIENFLFLFKRVVNGFGYKVVREYELAPDKKGVDSIFGRSGTWIICDISQKGLLAYKESAMSRGFVTEEMLYNPRRVREAARVRARYIMGLLEFYSACKFLQDYPEAHLMVDGLFYPYRRVKTLFEMTRNEYIEKMEKVVGFIKYPQQIPQKILPNLFTLHEGECLCWTGTPSEAEEDETYTIKEEEKISKDFFRFAVLRFRSKTGESIPSPIGIVKLQISPEKEKTEEVIKAVLYEKYPVPTDRRRLYNEPFPIEIAEKVAKSILPSEDRIKGFVLSIVS